MITAGAPAGLSQASPASADSMERAVALIQSRSFEQAAVMLRHIVSTDPANRRAKEMLAFALESRGDLEGERQVRSTLAARFPDDPRIQTDYG
ncbi:MAG TPA: tetratricopeptide repeat protein, partial [Candidatus Eisenbacteria bacterium]|nr:tetratricopeptide repeat protein [Candidatus Eisenbacteria bacterium]